MEEFKKFQDFLQKFPGATSEDILKNMKNKEMEAQMNQLNIENPDKTSTFDNPEEIEKIQSEQKSNQIDANFGLNNQIMSKFILNQDQYQEEVVEQPPIRKSKRQVKQTTGKTIYDEEAKYQDDRESSGGGRLRKQVGRKTTSHVQMNIDDDMAVGSSEMKIQSPIQPNRMVYKSTWNAKNNIEHDVKCDVCLDDDDGEGDEIVMCDGCNVAVH
jgi:hypothetical protein